MDKRRLVYMAHPYNGATGSSDEQLANLTQNDRMVKKIAETYPDIIPISPLWTFGKLAGRVEECYMLPMYCLPLLGVCDELWLLGKWQLSKGIGEEINYAIKHDIPIYARVETENGFYMQKYMPALSEVMKSEE